MQGGVHVETSASPQHQHGDAVLLDEYKLLDSVYTKDDVRTMVDEMNEEVKIDTPLLLTVCFRPNMLEFAS